MITSALAHAARSHTRVRTCHGFQGSTASAGTRDRTILCVKINDTSRNPYTKVMHDYESVVKW